MMKLAIVTIIGPANKWGYERTYFECIGNQAQFADHVYLVQSTPDHTGIDRLLVAHDNITLISEPDNWRVRVGADDDVKLSFKSNVRLLSRNYQIGKQVAWRAGHDVVMMASSNSYVPTWTWEGVRAVMAGMLERGEPEAMMYHCWQLGPVLLTSTRRAPWIENAQLWTAVDLDYTPNIKWRPFAGQPNGAYYVDVSYELTAAEFYANLTRFGFMDKWLAGPHELDEVLRAYVNTVQHSQPWDLKLDATGQAIAAAHQPDYVSAYLLNALRKIGRVR
jgi:hypothetical protein